MMKSIFVFVATKQGGVPLRFMHAPCRTGSSSTTDWRRNKTIAACMISQTVKERPVVQTMRNWTTVEKTSMTDTDLEQLKVVLNGSQRTLQDVAR